MHYDEENHSKEVHSLAEQMREEGRTSRRWIHFFGLLISALGIALIGFAGADFWLNGSIRNTPLVSGVFLEVISLVYFFVVRKPSGGVEIEFLRPAIQRASEARNIQEVAASQLELLVVYHQSALAQSNKSFFWAVIGSGFGLLLFAIAVGFSMLNGLNLASIVPLIAGAIVQLVSGVVFYLYGQTSSQLSSFHSRLEELQRYMLANSICESLGETERDKTRAALIGELSRARPRAA